MRILLIFALLVNLAIAGCAPARIYTFEKERVDQDMSGNRGYAKGAPPIEPRVAQVPKRTMIGIDFEIGLLPSEKEKIKQIEGEKAEEKTAPAAPSLEKTEEKKVEEKIAEEEAWIK